jgi:predicted nucleotidyltransferase
MSEADALHMHGHHAETLARVVEHFQQDPEVQGLILGGSLAHGLARAGSDVDVLIVVAPEAYERRRQTGHLQYFTRELVTYDDGYVDGKYVTANFIRQVAERGSEPARFQFKDARVLFSNDEELGPLVQAAARYPTEGLPERMGRFAAQLEAWHWYSHEALKLGDPYLYGVAASKLVLFGGRLILAHNQLLYPFHKWFLKVLEGAPDKPAGLMELIWPLYEEPTAEASRAFYEAVKNFRQWPTAGDNWPSQFMRDNELNWLDGAPPVDDL